MIDLANKKYGKLTVIKLAGERGSSGQIYWECKCDCGNIHVVSGESLRGGKSKSCGCARKTPPNKVEDREYAIKKQLYKTNIKKRSQRLGFDYNISLEDYIKLIEQPCFYCGIKDSNYATDRYNTKKNGRKTSDTIVHYKGLERLQQLELLGGLEHNRFDLFNNNTKLTLHTGSYIDYKYQEGDVVYCDIPYENTEVYSKDGFNHKEFYDWALTRDFPVYISSYELPDRFSCIFEKEKRCLMNGASSNYKTEKLFTNK